MSGTRRHGADERSLNDSRFPLIDYSCRLMGFISYCQDGLVKPNHRSARYRNSSASRGCRIALATILARFLAPAVNEPRLALARPTNEISLFALNIVFNARQGAAACAARIRERNEKQTLYDRDVEAAASDVCLAFITRRP